jgi:hypothetical protein
MYCRQRIAVTPTTLPVTSLTHSLTHLLTYSLTHSGLIMNCVEEFVKANNLGDVNDGSLTHMLRSYLASCVDHPAIIHAGIGTHSLALLTHSLTH